MNKIPFLLARYLIFSGILAVCPMVVPACGKDTNEAQKAWANSLGMTFVPVPGTDVLFSIWDTRVSDFRAYTKATGYRQTGGI